MTSELSLVYFVFVAPQGAIMAVGASEPTVVASKEGRIGMKNQMQVVTTYHFILIYFLHQ